jgi:hypothetical protein
VQKEQEKYLTTALRKIMTAFLAFKKIARNMPRISRPTANLFSEILSFIPGRAGIKPAR